MDSAEQTPALASRVVESVKHYSLTGQIVGTVQPGTRPVRVASASISFFFLQCPQDRFSFSANATPFPDKRLGASPYSAESQYRTVSSDYRFPAIFLNLQATRLLDGCPSPCYHQFAQTRESTDGTASHGSTS